MSSVLTIREDYRSAFRLRAIAERVIRLGGTHVLVGALISSLGSQISQPGMIAWTTVMGVFGGLIGFLGGRVIDVLLGSGAAAVLFASTSQASADLSSADAIATGLLMGAIAGGLFRPWCKLSFGLCSLLISVLKSLAGKQ